MGQDINVNIGANSKKLDKELKRSNLKIGQWVNKIVSRGFSIGMDIGRAIATSIRRALIVGMVGLGAIIKKSLDAKATFEAFEMQFASLFGGDAIAKSMAKGRMQLIRQVDLDVPFDIESIANASRLLTVFTNNAFAGRDALIMMADAAAATPNDIQDVAFWYGRAYSMIQSGRPFGEAAMRLQEMGLISGEARNKMEALAKAKGPDTVSKMMATLNEEFQKFDGTSKMMMGTWKGMSSVFGSGVKQSFEQIGEAIMPLAKVWLQEVIDLMQRLRDNRSFEQFGFKVANAFYNARTAVENFVAQTKSLTEGGLTIGEALKIQLEPITEGLVRSLRETWSDIKPYAVDIGKGIAQGIKDGISAGINDSILLKTLLAPLTVGNVGKEFAAWMDAIDEKGASRADRARMELEFGLRMVRAREGKPDMSMYAAQRLWDLGEEARYYMANPEEAKAILDKLQTIADNTTRPQQGVE